MAALARPFLLMVALLAAAPAGNRAAAQPRDGASAPPPPSQGRPQELAFGVFPFLTAERLETAFAPLAAQLSRALSRPVSLYTAATFEAYAERLATAEFDFAYMQPFDYVEVAADAGYQPVARTREALVGVLVARVDSPVRGWEDLRGAVVATPPAQAAVSRLVEIELGRRGLADSVRQMYTSTHDACMQRMLVGDARVCASVEPTVEALSHSLAVELRTVGRTASIPGVLFAVHSRVAASDRARFRQILLDLEEHPLLSGMAQGRPYVAATDSDYHALRSLLEAAATGRQRP